MNLNQAQNSWMKLTWSWALLIGVTAFCFFLLRPLSAQTSQGDFTGTVRDPTQALTPGVKITIINETTQAKREALTDSSGSYRLNGFFVGTYTIQAELGGFKKFFQPGIRVRPGDLVRLDISLQIGEVTETVEVVDTLPTVETESPALTTGIPKVGYAEKPIMNQTRAGYTFDPLTWAPGSASGRAIYSYQGNRASGNQTNIEGSQHDMFLNRVPTTAISEVNVVFVNAPAEYARPATADATIRSGGNRFTGEWLANFVNPCTQAQSTPFRNIKRTSCRTEFRNFWTFGGPIYVPKVYDGRNKSFFFVTINKNPASSVTGIPVAQSIPTQAMQRGDYLSFPTVIKDPLTGLPFAGNIIPDNRINQTAKAWNQEFYSKYTYVGGPNNFVNNGNRQGSYFGTGRSFAMKFDQNVGAKDVFTGSWAHLAGTSGQTRDLSAPLTSGETRVANNLLQTYEGNIATIAHTHTFTPRMVNQVRGSVSRYRSLRFEADGEGSTSPLYGKDVLKTYNILGIPETGFSGRPQMFITNWSFTTNDNEVASTDTRYQVYDNVSITQGRHTIKFGYSGIKLLEDGPASGVYFGNFTFNGNFTGEPYADFLLGLPSTFQRYVPRPVIARRMWEHGAFVQDDFKVSPKLTLNYGLRWDRFTVPYDKNGLYYNFDTKTGAVVVPDDFARQNINPAWPSQTFPVKTAAEVGFPTKLFNGKQNWLPRFGFAWRPFDEKTVIRGGYGVYTGALRFTRLQVFGPFAITESFINIANPANPSGAQFAFPNPFPASSATANVATITGYNLNFRTPYSQNWNLTAEREFAPNWGVRLSYIGVKDTQLPYLYDLNSPILNDQPFSQNKRPIPSLQAINLGDNGGNGYYHASQLRVTHPFTRGLWFDAAYTYQRSKTDVQPGAFDRDQIPTGIEYFNDRARQKGRNAFWPTQDFITNWVLELPFGKGKKWGSNWSQDLGVGGKVLNQIAGGWTTTGSFSWRSGNFFTPVLNGVDPGGLGSTSNRRPDVVPGCDPYAGAKQLEQPFQWFNRNCFVAPPPGKLGNAEFNGLTGPGAWVFNLNPFKDFPMDFIREGTRIQIGANIYNLFNHPAYSVPNNNVLSPTGGRITLTDYARAFSHDYANMRQFVLTARFIF